MARVGGRGEGCVCVCVIGFALQCYVPALLQLHAQLFGESAQSHSRGLQEKGVRHRCESAHVTLM